LRVIVVIYLVIIVSNQFQIEACAWSGGVYSVVRAFCASALATTGKKKVKENN